MELQEQVRRSTAIKISCSLWSATLKQGDRTSIPKLMPIIETTADWIQAYIEKTGKEV